VLPGICPTVLGTLSIELVVVVCAVRVEMACGPGARQPPSSAWVMLRAGARSVSAPRIGIPRYDGLEFRGCRGVPACGMRAWARHCYGRCIALGFALLWALSRHMGFEMAGSDVCFAMGFELHGL